MQIIVDFFFEVAKIAVAGFIYPAKSTLSRTVAPTASPASSPTASPASSPTCASTIANASSALSKELA
jgi:hypothetical protein